MTPLIFVVAAPDRGSNGEQYIDLRELARSLSWTQKRLLADVYDRGGQEFRLHGADVPAAGGLERLGIIRTYGRHVRSYSLRDPGLALAASLAA